MKAYAEQFYSSGAWKKCRAAYKKSRQGLCEQCLRNGIIEAGVIVHHKVHITPHNVHVPEIAMNYDNLELLCRKCHGEIHGGHFRRYKADESGHVTPLVLPEE